MGDRTIFLERLLEASGLIVVVATAMAVAAVAALVAVMVGAAELTALASRLFAALNFFSSLFNFSPSNIYF